MGQWLSKIVRSVKRKASVQEASSCYADKGRRQHAVSRFTDFKVTRSGLQLTAVGPKIMIEFGKEPCAKAILDSGLPAET